MEYPFVRALIVAFCVQVVLVVLWRSGMIRTWALVALEGLALPVTAIVLLLSWLEVS